MQWVGQTATQAGSCALLHPVDAERALVGIPVGVNEPRVIGAGGQAGLAADTQFGINQHHLAEIVHVARAGGAAVDTGRIVAVVAALAADLLLQVRETRPWSRW